MIQSKILVVDDDISITGMLKLVLEQFGDFDVCVENCSRSALIAAHAFRPDLVLLDMEMPGKSGGEVASEMKSDPALSGVPLVFCSGRISSTDAGSHGVVRDGMRYLSKPIAPLVLVAALNDILAEGCVAA